MLILRIRQAEVALHDNRLDEAFDLAQEKALQAHRRGQQLIGKLVRALVGRGQDHLAAGRATAALTDCDKAARLGGNLPEIAELRTAAAASILSDQRTQRQRALLVAAARDHIEQGRLNFGEKLLANVEGFESRAALVMQDLNAKKTSLEAALKAAQNAIDRDDLEAAARELMSANSGNSDDSRVAAMIAKTGEQLARRVSSAIDTGRLDLAESLSRSLSKLACATSSNEHLIRAIEQCRLAWNYLDRGQPHQAAEILRRQAIVFPSAKWMGTAIKELQQAEEALRSLRAGPLGLLSMNPNSPTEAPPSVRDVGVSPAQKNKFDQRGRDAHATGDAMIPSKFILRVDGAGSFCVLRQPLVTVGSVSSPRVPDLGLIAEPGLPLATIERSDEDYFIRGSTIAVNDQPAANKLLASGDRIALSPRCRMAFAIPVATSTSAVLDLTGARFPRAEVRRVILLDRDLVLGPGNATHVRVEDASENIILHLRDARLFCETKLPVEVNGAPMDRVTGIPLNAHVKVGAVSFVISRE